MNQGNRFTFLKGDGYCPSATFVSKAEKFTAPRGGRIHRAGADYNGNSQGNELNPVSAPIGLSKHFDVFLGAAIDVFRRRCIFLASFVRGAPGAVNAG